jgi:hypothetical protein
MKELAQIVVETAAFFEFVPDDVFDPDDAVRHLEDIAFHLGRASEEEKQAVLAVCRARIDAMDEHTSAQERKFYEDFGDAFGLLPEEENG